MGSPTSVLSLNTRRRPGNEVKGEEEGEKVEGREDSPLKLRTFKTENV